MPIETAIQLKQHLFEAYGGFADKRIRNIERDEPFIVDDRGEGDYDARKQLFLWFTLMFANVRSATEVELIFRGGTPESQEVNTWFTKHDANRNGNSISVMLNPENFSDLDGLAVSVERITRKRYDTPAYKYVVPRVAGSIRQFCHVLGKAWS